MVAKAKVRIEGEDATAAAWRSAMGRAKKSADQMSGIWRTAFAGVSFGAIASLTKRQIELGDTLAKGAQKAGMAGKEFSAYAYAAKLADVEVQGLSTSIKFMQMNLSKAAAGEKEQIELLGALGIKVKDIKDLKPGEQFELIAEQISRMASEEDRARVLTAMFGKAGGELGPMFEEGAEGIRKARLEAEQLGLAFDDKQLAALAQADDSIKRLSASWDGFATVLATRVAPNLSWTLDRLAGVPLDVNEQIANLEDELAAPNYQRGAAHATEEGRRAKLRDRLAALRKISREQSAREMGVGGYGASAPPPGYTPGSGSTKEADRAEKERLDRAAEAHDRMADAAMEHQQAVADMNERLDEHVDVFADSVEEEFERIGEAIEDLEITKPLLDDAEAWQEMWSDGWDAWQQNGEHTTRELAKFMLMELGQKLLTQTLGNWFDSMGGMGASGSTAALGSIFGGSYASGGDAAPNKVIEVGEAGRELVWTGRQGAHVTPNHMLGGGNAPVINLHIDARGATVDAVKLLPAAGRQIIKEAEALIVGKIARGSYPELRR